MSSEIDSTLRNSGSQSVQVAPQNSQELPLTIGELLVDFARIMATYGPDSKEAKEMLECYQTNKEFVDLAELSRVIKREWQSDSSPTMRLTS